ncbi:tyrosine-type recombinase/integrase [Candidatus Methylospira mobilis]|uniref:Tyrosine-type recombinase/integrase n=1 Tax=Candidatus Methylospira mobilis TaxID=1808979 RepID=A0A5Q0BPR5_9GAMM|nr:tyrosine-type recombinase/integrase [Candidatus Methylospira mobilis]QFY44194.1 tyrosine-type recombinase/integrase [Candidatus Methylospira mobilis]WNV06381.1 tyrosine-type recombinase/integrase [Candidatus Methylospira mobilis]
MNDERKHLTGREIEKLLAAVKGTRNEARDRCLLVMLFRHGLRVSEALALKLNAVDLDEHTLHVTRLKNGLSTTHPLRRRAGLLRARLTPQGGFRRGGVMVRHAGRCRHRAALEAVTGSVPRPERPVMAKPDRLQIEASDT